MRRAAQATEQRILAIGRPPRERHAIDAHRGDRKKRQDANIHVGWCDTQINVVAEKADRIRPKRDKRNPREGERQSQQRRKVVDKFIDACRSRIFLEEKFHAVRQRLQQSVRTNAVRAPARLHVRDDFAFEPRQIGVHRQHDEQQQRDLDDRNNQLRVRG